MLAQRILKMPSSISLGVLELQSPNILTSDVQVKNPACSVVALMHGGSSCRFDSLYFYLKKCNIFVTKVSIYMYIHLAK